MITGFNTDIDHGDRVYHVQTEDKGLANPTVETLVYTGGEIISQRRSSYEDLIGEGFSEDDVLLRMEAQHQTTIRDILNGKFDSQGPKPLGHNIITNRSLDEVVLEFLSQSMAGQEIQLQTIDDMVLAEGTRPTLRMKVTERGSDRPVGGAEVTVSLISTAGQPLELFSGPTDGEGFIEALFEIPSVGEEDAAILCEADARGIRAEMRMLVERGPRPASLDAP